MSCIKAGNAKHQQAFFGRVGEGVAWREMMLKPDQAGPYVLSALCRGSQDLKSLPLEESLMLSKSSCFRGLWQHLEGELVVDQNKRQKNPISASSVIQTDNEDVVKAGSLTESKAQM